MNADLTDSKLLALVKHSFANSALFYPQAFTRRFTQSTCDR